MSWHIEKKYNDQITENRDSKTSSSEYDVWCDTPDQTIQAARAAFSAVCNSSNLRDIYGNSVESFSMEEDQDGIGDHFTATVSFAPYDKESKEKTIENDDQFWQKSFQSEGGSAHIVRGISEKSIGLNGNPLPINYRACIGWNGDQFEGCDKIVPDYKFQLKTRVKYNDWSNAQTIKLINAKGKTNLYQFYGFGSGNVLFSDFSGNTIFDYDNDSTEYTDDQGKVHKIPSCYIDLTFDFRVHPTVSIPGSRVSRVIGGVPVVTNETSISKEGFDYYWEEFETIESEETTYKHEIAGHVVQVYEKIDFFDLFGGI